MLPSVLHATYVYHISHAHNVNNSHSWICTKHIFGVNVTAAQINTAYDARLHSAVAAYGRLQRYVQQHAYLYVLIHVAYKLHQSTVFGLDKIKYHQQSIGGSSKLSDQ